MQLLFLTQKKTRLTPSIILTGNDLGLQILAQHLVFSQHQKNTGVAGAVL